MAGDRYDPTDAERARWTMADMRSWVKAIEAYRSDKGHYPLAGSLEEARDLIMPFYIRIASMNDAWGRAYHWEASEDGSSYRIASAGADGRFARDSWLSEGESDDFLDDAVASDGSFVRAWSYR